MDLELRPATEEEFPVFARAIATAFGFVVDDNTVADWRASNELDRTIGVFEGDDVVGTAGAYSFGLMLPGGASVPAAGVTIVGVRPTHRRRGILTRMMRHQLDDVVRRGEPYMVLTASEAAIYERFSYGAATFSASWALETEGLELAHSSRVGGRLRLVDNAEARKVVPGLFEQARHRHVGAVTRGAPFWDLHYGERPPRGPRTAQFTVVHESDDGVPDGFARYRIEQGEGLKSTLVVVDLDGVDNEVEAALWDYLIHVDLVVRVRTENRPVDDVVPWRLADRRRVRFEAVKDHLWVRVVEPAAALSARRYHTDDALVIELVDGFRPDNDGRWRIAGGPDGAEVTRTDDAPDLSLGASELGSISLGGVAASVLAGAGRVHEVTAGALARADAFFGVQPAPWCATHF